MRKLARAGWVAGLLVLPGAALGQSMLGNAAGDGSGPGNLPPGTDQNTVAVPPPPPIVSTPLSAPLPQVVTPQPAPPGLVQTPVPPVNADTGQPGTDGTAADNGAPVTPDAAATAPVTPGAAPAAPDTASSTPPPPANTWLPEHTAQIGLLDKVDGGASTVTIPVGGQTDAGDLRISVLACATRPPGEIPDDAVFVSIQPVATGATGTAATTLDNASGSATGGPIFRGWMVRSIPGATVVGDASETLRVVSCS
jgi:hypothetical protein